MHKDLLSFPAAVAAAVIAAAVSAAAIAAAAAVYSPETRQN